MVLVDRLVGSDKLWSMPARKRPSANNHLQEAMALLIRNQAAFVEQIARNDQERLGLQRKSDVWQLKNDERWRKTEEWQRRSEERFDRIEERLARVEADLLKLPKTIVQTILDQLPRIRKEIGFKVQK
jgi:oligoendopeptidase F